MSTVAYKLVDAAEWRAARAAGAYEGSAVDRADGYIHMSTAVQLVETGRRHYAGREGLLLLEVALDGLGAALRWEPSRVGELFPHLYAPLPLEAARGERELAVDSEGRPRFADGATQWP